MRTRHLRAELLSPLAILAADCGGGSSSPPSPAAPACRPASQPLFTYVLDGFAADTVSMCSVNSCTGNLTPTTPTVTTEGNAFGCEGMVVDPARKFAYVANLGSNAADEATISMYTINSSTGVLTPTTSATGATVTSLGFVTVHPSGKFANGSNRDDDTVSMDTTNSSAGIFSLN
jgi:6-phosphogluconolactonase (cycloisomerase 2 family)